MTSREAGRCAALQHPGSAEPVPRNRAPAALRLAGVAAVSLVLANCSQQRVGSAYDPKYGVSASPRVVAEGEPVPKGGGRDLVGKPYVVAGRTYYPQENPRYVGEGLASWYGANFHGRLTANGEIFDRDAVAAAHTTMPLPSYARVTNLENGRSIIVRVNDRGPYHANRVIDVSQRTAEALDFRRSGTARVRVEYVRRASPNGSDDRLLLATLRTDGRPAALTGATPTMVASAEPRSDVPRQALALRSYEPGPIGDEAAVSRHEPLEAFASQSPVPSAAPVPLPPRRPLDLFAPPNAAGAAPSAASTGGASSQPAMAGLSLSPAALSGAERKELRGASSATKEASGLNLRR
jgi:rare lipoprotein A